MFFSQFNKQCRILVRTFPLLIVPSEGKDFVLSGHIPISCSPNYLPGF